ncbi:hypothetical protein ACWGH2_37470 [Streptomyces sp. NPDC054871]
MKLEAAGLDTAEEKIFDIYDADLKGEEGTEMSAAAVITKMPYDFSPARMRCMELAGRLFGEALADAHSATADRLCLALKWPDYRSRSSACDRSGQTSSPGRNQE